MNTGYVPPQNRHNTSYKSKSLTYVPKEIKTKEQLFEKYRQENYGKADDAWGEN